MRFAEAILLENPSKFPEWFLMNWLIPIPMETIGK
jgi:hypothetical protein